MSTIKRGRPAGGAPKRGRTPPTSVVLDPETRALVMELGGGSFIREAIAEKLTRMRESGEILE